MVSSTLHILIFLVTAKKAKEEILFFSNVAFSPTLLKLQDVLNSDIFYSLIGLTKMNFKTKISCRLKAVWIWRLYKYISLLGIVNKVKREIEFSL